MDKQAEGPSESQLLRRATEVLGSYLNREPIISSNRHQGKDQEDAALEIALAEGSRHFAVELKIGLRPNNLGAVLHRVQSRKREKTILIADYVSPPVAERLRSLGISYLDAAGNAWIHDPPLMIWVSGRRRDRGIKAPATGRKAFQATGLRVVFAMLCHQDWCNLPYRELAMKTGVAHGSVGHVMSDLTALGYVFEVQGRRRLTQKPKLLQQWVEAYPRSLRSSLSMGRFEIADSGSLKNLRPSQYGLQWGGEMAASLLTKYLQPATWTLYGSSLDRDLMPAFKLRPDPNGRVEVLKRFWNFPEPSGQETVPLPLVYADLLMNGDGRSLETAQMILERIDGGSV